MQQNGSRTGGSAGAQHHRRLRRAGRIARAPARWWRCNSGVSAIEFGLMAPILGFVLIASIDLGFAISERMALDHVLRTGAQSAMLDAGEVRVSGVMHAAAAPNFGPDESTWAPGGTPATFSVSRYCACATSVKTAVACSMICPGSQPTFIYYRMSARKTYAGRITPDLDFDRALQVQVR